MTTRISATNRSSSRTSDTPGNPGEDGQPPDTKRGLHASWRLIKLAFAYRWHFSATIAAVVISSTFFLWIPRLLGDGVDQAFTLIRTGNYEAGEVRSLLITTAILLMVASLLRGTFAFFQQFLGESLSQRLSAWLRMSYFDKLQRLSFSFHDNVHTGNVMSRGISDIEHIRMFVQAGVVRTVMVTLLTFGSAAAMILIDWQLALISMSFVPFVAFRSGRLQLRLRQYWRRIQETLSELSMIMHENVAGVRVVRAFSAQSFEDGKFDKVARHSLGLRMRAVAIQASNGSVMSFAFLMAWALILRIGGYQVVDGQMTVGELTQFFAFMGLLQMPVRQIPMLLNAVSRGHSAGVRVFEILDAPEVVQDRPGAKSLEAKEGVVRFEDVSFEYGAVEALAHISFEARPDHTIGIVGPPGSGKSTIAALMPRFYDARTGRVTIDGTDVRDVTLDSLRGAVGLVQQDPFLFDGSVRDNIRYGNPQATDEQVAAAAKLAQIHDFVETLPEGYDTEIGERGVGLSGGQRQRMAIARTLLPDPKVLIFDDSTSSVDAGTDRRIREQLRNHSRSHTTIIIAHRLSSIEHADEILVLDRGRIVERGRHDELLRLEGRYKELWELQQRPALDEASRRNGNGRHAAGAESHQAQGVKG